jgi:hypothetical protein
MRTLEPAEAYQKDAGALRAALAALPPADVEGRRRMMERLTMVNGSIGVAARRREGGPRTLHPEVQVLSFGNGVAVLGLPGEFFAETAQAIRAAAGVPHLMISCYTNHHVFYVVPAHAFDQGGYEPGVSVLDAHAEAIFREAAIELLREGASE